MGTTWICLLVCLLFLVGGRGNPSENRGTNLNFLRYSVRYRSRWVGLRSWVDSVVQVLLLDSRSLDTGSPLGIFCDSHVPKSKTGLCKVERCPTTRFGSSIWLNPEGLQALLSKAESPSSVDPTACTCRGKKSMVDGSWFVQTKRLPATQQHSGSSCSSWVILYYTKYVWCFIDIIRESGAWMRWMALYLERRFEVHAHRQCTATSHKNDTEEKHYMESCCLKERILHYSNINLSFYFLANYT
jgi:hypothetical protein